MNNHRLYVLLVFLILMESPLLVVVTSTGNITLYTNSYLGLIEPGNQYISFSEEKVFTEVYRRNGYWYLLEPGSTSHWRIRVEANITISTLASDVLEAYSTSTDQHVFRVYNPYNPLSQVQATVNGDDWTDNVSYKYLGDDGYVVELNNISPGDNIQIIISWTTIPIPEPWIISLVTIASILLVLIVFYKKH